MFGSSTKEGVMDCTSLSLYLVEMRQMSVWLWDASVIFSFFTHSNELIADMLDVIHLGASLNLPWKKGEHTCTECLDVVVERSLEIMLKVRGEVPSRKGEHCLKSFRGNHSPYFMLAFSFILFCLTYHDERYLHCSIIPEHRYRNAQFEGKLLYGASFLCLLQICLFFRSVKVKTFLP